MKRMANTIYIGIMSGTSMDGIDVAIVDFSKTALRLIATHTEKIPSQLREKLLALCVSNNNEIINLGQADTELGRLFAKAILNVLDKTSLKPSDIHAIGSHGQTVRHVPKAEFPFTLQIADPNTIAERTEITTVADFRRRDMAAQGQGAPLVPAFHDVFFRDTGKSRIILNIGGIANITVLNKNPIIGFDTGPGNTLMDAWCLKNVNRTYDHDGAWAASGHVILELLEKLLSDPYFKNPAPKSTGREYFNLTWLAKLLQNEEPEDVQATLLALTVHSIANEIKKHPECQELIVCGGGAHNTYLMQELKKACSTIHVASSESLGINPSWIEAIAFAWLAKQTLEKKPGNITSVTGAKREVILGGVYWGRRKIRPAPRQE